MGRVPCCDKANVKKGPWAPEEDAMLKAYIEEHGTGGNWIALPPKIGLKRCGKSCRLRWLNYLRPNLKHGGFSEEEDRIICSLYISIGSRWSIIAAQLPGRTDNDIKNYWNTRLKKKLLGKRRESSQSRRLASDFRPKEDAHGIKQDTSSQGLSESALERMQLHMQLRGLSNPYSFYNNPALWPKSHLLRQETDAVSPSRSQQAFEGTTSEPTREPAFLMNSDVTVSATTQEDRNSSTLGFPSPSSIGTTLNAENTNLGVDAVYAAGLPTEFHDLLYNKNSIFELQEEHQILKLDCYKEIYGEKDGVSWWPSSSFEHERSSAGSWEYSSVLQSDSLVQGHTVAYDILASEF